MDRKITTIDEYIALYPEEIQKILRAMRETIHRAAPDATETIRYGIPTFQLHGNLVHFAAFKNHIGFYPTPSGIDQFKTELAAYNTSKGTVQFPLEKTIPYDLVEKIVRFRADENRKS